MSDSPQVDYSKLPRKDPSDIDIEALWAKRRPVDTVDRKAPVEAPVQDIKNPKLVEFESLDGPGVQKTAKGISDWSDQPILGILDPDVLNLKLLESAKKQIPPDQVAMRLLADLAEVPSKVSSGFRTPKNLAMLGAMFAVPEAGVPRLFKSLVNAGFTATNAIRAASQFYQSIKDYQNYRKTKNPEHLDKVVDDLSSGIVDTILAGLGAYGMSKGGPAEQVSKPADQAPVTAPVEAVNAPESPVEPPVAAQGPTPSPSAEVAPEAQPVAPEAILSERPAIEPKPEAPSVALHPPSDDDIRMFINASILSRGGIKMATAEGKLTIDPENPAVKQILGTKIPKSIFDQIFSRSAVRKLAKEYPHVAAEETQLDYVPGETVGQALDRYSAGKEAIKRQLAGKPEPVRAPATSIEPDAKKAVEDAGGQYRGLQERGGGAFPLAKIHDPQTETTFNMELSEITPESVRARLEAKRQEFSKAREAPALPPVSPESSAPAAPPVVAPRFSYGTKSQSFQVGDYSVSYAEDVFGREREMTVTDKDGNQVYQGDPQVLKPSQQDLRARAESEIAKHAEKLRTPVEPPKVEEEKIVRLSPEEASRERISGSQVTGWSSDLYTPDGQHHRVTYKLVEVDRVLGSHNPWTFAPEFDYPQYVQERTYDLDKEEQNKVIKHAQEYDLFPAFTVNTNPDGINGPPIVTTDNIVLGGNSRLMSLRRIYKSGKGDVYRGYLKDRLGSQFGINPEEVDKFEKPMLVRVLNRDPSDPEKARRVAQALNRSHTGAQNVDARAVSYGRSVTVRTATEISEMANDIGVETTFRELMAKRPREVLNLLQRDQIISENERGSYVDNNGALTDEGKVFMNRLLLGSVINDVSLLQNAPPSMLNKVEWDLPQLIGLKARTDEWDITPVVREALREFTKMQVAGEPIEVVTKKPFKTLKKELEIETLVPKEGETGSIEATSNLKVGGAVEATDIREPKDLGISIAAELRKLAGKDARRSQPVILKTSKGTLRTTLGEIEDAATGLERHVNQGGMFQAGKDPVVVAMMRFFNARRPEIIEGFGRFAEDARQQGGLGLSGVPDPWKSFNEAFGGNITEDQYREAITRIRSEENQK